MSYSFVESRLDEIESIIFNTSVDENENFNDLCEMYYSQYMNEINNHGYNKNRNYIQIWDTMINTRTRESIRLLHQTSVQRSN